MAYRQKRSICSYIRNGSIFVKTQKVQDVSRHIEKRMDRWTTGEVGKYPTPLTSHKQQQSVWQVGKLVSRQVGKLVSW